MPLEPNPSRALYTATVERITAHNADTRSLFLRLRAGCGFAFVPGQFLSLQLPIANGAIRPYSIASDPETPELLEICFNLVPGGVASRYLFDLAVGAQIHFTGPWGTFTLRDPPGAECVFLADGTGIAPIRPMLHRALAGSVTTPIRLHYRAASLDALLFRPEFEIAQRRCADFVFEPIVNDSAEALLDSTRVRYVEDDADRTRHFYVCGVGDVVTKLRDLLRTAGYARRAVEYEKW